METYTPGPWTVEKRVSCWAICDSKGQDVTYQDDKPRFYQGEPCGSTTSQGRTAAELAANARLIAAAPDLLDALRELAFAARARENRAGDPCGYLEAKAELAKAERIARAAIAKAED